MQLIQRHVLVLSIVIFGLGTVFTIQPVKAQGELQTEVARKAIPNKVAFLVKDDRMLRSSVMSAVEMLEGKGYPAEKAAVVVIGPALKLLEKGSDAESQIKQAMQSGLQIDACEVAMKHMGINSDQLIDGVKPVDNGFFQIFRLQEQGY